MYNFVLFLTCLTIATAATSTTWKKSDASKLSTTTTGRTKTWTSTATTTAIDKNVDRSSTSTTWKKSDAGKLSTTTSGRTKTWTSTATTAAIDTSVYHSSTSVPSSLSEKINYQIYQTHLINDIVDENRSTLKRLMSMVSRLLENNIGRTTSTFSSFNLTNINNHKTNDNSNSSDMKKIHVEKMEQINQAAHLDNDTLHISFGADADPDRYPWAVAVRGNDRDRCGGTLIDDLHVLTAAHCIGTRITEVTVGSHLYNGGESMKTNFYGVHHAYSSSNYYRNDLAIIRLARPVSVQLPKRVASVQLCARSNIINATVSSDKVDLWMIGWGLKNNNIEPNELQEARVTIADRSLCKGSSRYTDMCVKSRSNTSPMGACIGDSGSGLLQQTIANDQWCLLGVTSSSNSDICEQTQFTTYAQAASADYVEWFKETTDRKKTFDDLQKSEKCKTRTLGQELCRWYAC